MCNVDHRKEIFVHCIARSRSCPGLEWRETIGRAQGEHDDQYFTANFSYYCVIRDSSLSLSSLASALVRSSKCYLVVRHHLSCCNSSPNKYNLSKNGCAFVSSANSGPCASR